MKLELLRNELDAVNCQLPLTSGKMRKISNYENVNVFTLLHLLHFGMKKGATTHYVFLVLPTEHPLLTVLLYSLNYRLHFPVFIIVYYII